jgi:hypothetical protein
MTKKEEEVTKLTPEQQEECRKWQKLYQDIGTCTEPSDRPRAEKAMCAIYRRLGFKEPEFLWFDSPKAAIDFVEEQTGKRPGLGDVRGQLDAYWGAFYAFCRHLTPDIYNKEDSEQLDEWLELIKSTGPCWPYEHYCLMSERPSVVKFDEDMLLHCEDGPALLYRDGWAIHAIHGKRQCA